MPVDHKRKSPCWINRRLHCVEVVVEAHYVAGSCPLALREDVGYGLPVLTQLLFDLGILVGVDYEYVYHFVRQKSAGIADVDGSFCKKELNV